MRSHKISRHLISFPLTFLKTLTAIHNKRVCHVYNITLVDDNSYILPPYSTQETRLGPVSQDFISPVETFKTLAKGWLIQFISVNSWLCPSLADNSLWFTSERVPIVCWNRVSTDSAFRLDQLFLEAVNGLPEMWHSNYRCVFFLRIPPWLSTKFNWDYAMSCPALPHSGLPYPVLSCHVTAYRVEINEYLIGQYLLVKVNWNTVKFHDTCMTMGYFSKLDGHLGAQWWYTYLCLDVCVTRCLLTIVNDCLTAGKLVHLP